MADTSLIRPSSTVVVARDGDDGPEVFMVRRHHKSAFGSAHAFPGGVIDPEDAAVHEYCDGLTAAEANSRLGVEDGGLDYYSGAVRELFEETGVLLGDTSDLDENLASVRDTLNDGSGDWVDIVTRNKLRLQCGDLHYFSHWITPPTEVKRYSTRFFLTSVPHDQEPMHCGGELTESCWTTATDMLTAWRQGEVKLIFPTVKTLESIARHKTVDSLMEWASSCVEWGITTMVPVTIERDGKVQIVLPGDKDYPGAKS